MKRLIVRHLAQADIAAATQWYEEHQTGLGWEFLDAVQSTYDLIQEQPNMFPEVDAEIRRAIVQRFPYGVFYVVHSRHIAVIGVFHLRRSPQAWRNRR